MLWKNEGLAFAFGYLESCYSWNMIQEQLRWTRKVGAPQLLTTWPGPIRLVALEYPSLVV